MHYRAAFISDLHLGSGQTNYTALRKFLLENTFGDLFLLGDIIHKTPLMSPMAYDALDLIKESPYTYIAGNNDMPFSHGYDYLGPAKMYTTFVDSRGIAWLLTHGHQFTPPPTLWERISSRGNKLTPRQIHEGSETAGEFADAIEHQVLDGVIFGHFHTPWLYRETRAGTMTCNTGCFVRNNASVIVDDGWALRLLHIEV